MIEALKAKESPALWYDLALWSVSQWPVVSGTIFVPVPGSGSPARRHALGFARALADITNGRVVDLLLPERLEAQKYLKKTDRGKKAYKISEPVIQSQLIKKSNSENKGLIVVDDVVTTGATLQAVARALRLKHRIEARTILDRRPCRTTPLLLESPP